MGGSVGAFCLAVREGRFKTAAKVGTQASVSSFFFFFTDLSNRNEMLLLLLCRFGLLAIWRKGKRVDSIGLRRRRRRRMTTIVALERKIK